MSFFIIQHNVEKMIQNQKRTRAMLFIDLHFQNLPNILIVSKTCNSQQYFAFFSTKKLQKIQVVLQNHVTQKYVVFKFKPILLLDINKQLNTQSQRCIIQLNNKLQQNYSINKYNYYKWYINKSGYLIIQISYSVEQFLNPLHVNFILNKTMMQLTEIIQQKIRIMLPYLHIQNINYQQQNQIQKQHTQNNITIYDKIKYMTLLTEVYKSHRKVLLEDQKRQRQNGKQLQFSNNIDNFSKANVLEPNDISLVQSLERQKLQVQMKFKDILRLVSPKIQGKKKDHLNMSKMHHIQKQIYEKHIQMVKKKNLDIYQITNTHFRIVRGIQNHISMSKQKILSAQGSHSNIFFGTYSLHLSETLFTYTNDVTEQQSQKKVVVKPLICKRIKNMELSPSVNSFKNQMDFLFYVKDKRSKHIASYFLPMNRAKYEACQIFAQYYTNNLKQYLEIRKKKKQIQINFSEILKICQNMVLALIFMVQNGILHRDIKPYNVMVDEKLTGRVIDFGSCCPIFNRTQFLVTQKRMLTTPAYQIPYKQLPPQLKKKYIKAQYQQHILFDVYSFGIVFKQMLEYLYNIQQLGRKQNIQLNQILDMLIIKCKEQDPLDRVTFDQLLYYIQILKQITIKE